MPKRYRRLHFGKIWFHITKKAYQIAIDKVNGRVNEIPVVEEEQWSFIEKKTATNVPNWISVIIHRSIPVKLSALEELANNLVVVLERGGR